MIQTLQEIIKKLTPPTIDYIVEKDDVWVSDTIRKAIPNAQLIILDGKYRLTNQTNFLNIVQWDWTERKSYIESYYDCEDFSLRFKININMRFLLNQVGLILDWSAGHAYNIIVFPDETVMLFEPQTDSMFFISERNAFYVLENEMILI